MPAEMAVGDGVIPGGGPQNRVLVSVVFFHPRRGPAVVRGPNCFGGGRLQTQILVKFFLAGLAEAAEANEADAPPFDLVFAATTGSVEQGTSSRRRTPTAVPSCKFHF